MAFEYRNPSNGDRIAAVPLDDDVWIKTTPKGCLVPPDRVEELVAGIRDAARTTSGQQPESGKPDPAVVDEAPLTDTERQFLKFALDLAFDRMVSDDGFTDEDEAALARLRRIAFGTEQLAEARPADLLAACATEYQVPVPEGGGTTLQVRRQSPLHGMGWAVSTRAYGGGRAWTTEGWQESISALSVDRLFCWPDATTAVNEARRALATVEEDETR